MKLKYKFAKLIATMCYIGYLPKAPGSWGSLATLPIFFLCGQLGQYELQLLLFPVICVVGWWASFIYQQRNNIQDPKEVVIDEMAGQWLVLLVAVFLFSNNPITIEGGVVIYNSPAAQNIFISMISLLLFRIFDITKPWPISIIDRKMKTAFGVMLDDIIAAIFAVIVLYYLKYELY